jgi:hypothetical protein
VIYFFFYPLGQSSGLGRPPKVLKIYTQCYKAYWSWGSPGMREQNSACQPLTSDLGLLPFKKKVPKSYSCELVTFIPEGYLILSSLGSNVCILLSTILRLKQTMWT